ncbi:MAG: 2-hydroxychromene-2-carboxylate isomerase [Caulobacterales bacterium]|nr:2-hydroxychromene-2-carboxylate isomerase [Caulobacterales bacterium]
MATIEFFFDLSSPWTRLAFHNIQPIAAEAGARILWRPFLVGGVFNAVNKAVYARRSDPEAPQARLHGKWLADWARHAGLAMNFPSPFHPLKSVTPMRVCCALQDDQDALFRFAGEAFEAYFTEQRDLDDPGVVAAVADACGLDGAGLIEAARTQPIKDRLRADTQEVIDRGGFGSPTMFVDRADIYFGNDQLPLLRLALAQGPTPA